MLFLMAHQIEQTTFWESDENPDKSCHIACRLYFSCEQCNVTKFPIHLRLKRQVYFSEEEKS